MNLLPPARKGYTGTLTSALLQCPAPRNVLRLGNEPHHSSRTAFRSPEQPLSTEQFAAVVKTAPLISVDLVVQNRAGEVLLGLRRNAPARGYWFVPGGRLFKNETIEQAIARVSRSELDLGSTESGAATLIGIFEHFYEDNFTGTPGFGTHYVVMAYSITANIEITTTLPQEQHAGYRWLSPSSLAVSRDVHPYSRAYAAHL